MSLFKNTLSLSVLLALSIGSLGALSGCATDPVLPVDDDREEDDDDDDEPAPTTKKDGGSKDAGSTTKKDASTGSSTGSKDAGASTTKKDASTGSTGGELDAGVDEPEETPSGSDAGTDTDTPAEGDGGSGTRADAGSSTPPGNSTGSGDVVGCLGLYNGVGGQYPCATTADGKGVCISMGKATALQYLPADTKVEQAAGAGFIPLSCAIVTGGAVQCQAYTGATTAARVIPSGARLLTGGFALSCAIVDGDAGAGVECWKNSNNPKTAKVQLAAGDKPVQVSCAHDQCCSLQDSGSVKCWDPAGEGVSAPVEVKGFASKPVAVGRGDVHGCVLLETGAVQCWGSDSNGALGGLAASQGPNPKFLVESGAAGLALGQHHTCVLMADGTVQCTGSAAAGLAGGKLAAVPGITDAEAISAGKFGSCVRRATGEVVCWGDPGGSGATPKAVEFDGKPLIARSCK